MKKLSWHTSWQSTILVEKMILPNHFSMSVEFESGAGNDLEQMVAFDRIKYLLNNIIEGCLFASVDHPLISKLEKNFDDYIVTLPTDPMDNVIASVLFSKIISIVEGRLDISSVTFSSRLGEDVSNYIDIDDLSGMDYMIKNKIKEATGTAAWWHRPDAGSTDIILTTKDKVSVMHDKQEWVDYDLDWDSIKMTLTKEDAAVVKLPANNWKPHVIPGGKDEDA